MANAVKQEGLVNFEEFVAQFSPAERKYFRESQKDFWDMCAVTETAEKKGREEGHAEGLEEGLAKGREEGRAEGRIEEKLQIARNMKEAGMSVDMIAKMTGLTVDEVAEAMK